ncbi:hypothetical protein [Paenibacillus sp. UNC451MF]|nr:hypothetical protein [Paenibacillus sp. UNC451MF]
MHYNSIAMFMFPMVIVFAVILLRYRWIVGIHNIVNQAFDEVTKDKI